MTAKQYRSAIERLGLSQVKAAAFLGVSPRQSRRWALGEAKIPKGYATLLRVMVDRGIKPDEI
jgi:DNA-binding transcriptional regulator YiaG